MDNPRAEKVAVVTEVREHFQRSSAAILTEYRGLSVKDLAGLRRTLRDAGSEYKIYKNTLVRFAASDLGLVGLEDLLVGPTAIAFIDGDASSVAKALREYARANPKLTVKGGVLGTKIMTVADATALADLPPREVVLARIAGALAAPMQTFAGLLQALPRSFAYGLKALIDLRGGPEEAPPAEAEAPVEDVAEAPAAPVEAEAPAALVEAEAPAEAEPVLVAAAAEPEPVAVAPEAEPVAAPAEVAATPEPEPVAVAPEPEPEPAAVAPEPEPEPEPEPVAVAPEPEPEPEPVAPEPEPVAVAPEPEPVAEEPEPEAEPVVAAPDVAVIPEPEAETEPEVASGSLSEQGEEDLALEEIADEDTPSGSEDPEDDDDPAAPPYDETDAPEESAVPAEVAAVHIEADSEDDDPEVPFTAADLEAPPADDDNA